MKVMNAAFGLGLLLVFASCAHVHEVKSTTGGVRVGIGAKEVSPGDLVTVLEQKCRPVITTQNRGGERCVERKIGEAIVLDVIDRKSAIVAPQGGLVMTDSMLVEKMEVSK